MLNLEYGIGRNAVIKHVFHSIFLPKAISFHIWGLKCICIFILFTKSMGQSCANSLDVMDSPSHMKYAAQSLIFGGQREDVFPKLILIKKAFQPFFLYNVQL